MRWGSLWYAGIIVLIALIVLGVFRYIEVRHRQTDPNWKLAQQIYNMENALKEVDEDYACKSLSKVTPFSYADSVGNTITYCDSLDAVVSINAFIAPTLLCTGRHLERCDAGCRRGHCLWHCGEAEIRT